MGSVLQFEGRKEMLSKKGPVFSTAIGKLVSKWLYRPPLFFLSCYDTYIYILTVAGVMGAKKTSELIPFCHPISLDDCQVEIKFDEPDRPNEVGR